MEWIALREACSPWMNCEQMIEIRIESFGSYEVWHREQKQSREFSYIPVNISSLSFSPVFTKNNFCLPSTVPLILNVLANPPPPCFDIVAEEGSRERAFNMAGSTFEDMIV